MNNETRNARRDKILVVDDTTANLQLLTNLLTKHGYSVFPASDGELALEFVRSILPDLILLDIRMPGMDGYEVCRRLKADERTRSIPIIFISILEDEREKVKGFQAGGVDYITKPFQPEEVLARVRTHLSLRELAERLEDKVIERTEELMIANQRLQQEIAERKRAEEALRESEAEYMDLYENAPDMYASVNARTALIEQCNSTLSSTLGYSKEEIIGRPVFEIYHPDCLEEIQEAFKLFRDTGEVRDKELQLRRKDSSRLDVSLNVSSVRDEEGNILYSRSTLRDITERKRAKEALVKSEARYRQIVDTASEGIWVVGPDAMTTFVNSRMAEMLGCSGEEMIGRPLTDFMFEEDASDHLQKIENCRQGISESYERRFRRQDGQTVWTHVSATPIFDDAHHFNGFFAMFTDITERKRTERVIAARMRLLQFAATHTLDELLEATLDEVEALTGSLIGFYHFLEADQKTLRLQNWSTRTKAEFCTAQGKGLHYDVSQAGVWVDCIHQRRPVIHDDYAALPHRKGLPPGHAPVIRELVVPVFRAEKIVAILGVGNKPRAYTSEDVEMVSLLADLAWEIVERKQAEEALQESERKYRSIVEHAPFGITHSTRDGKLLSVNPALAAILKYDSAQELQETINRSSIQDVLFPKPSQRAPLVENILSGDSWQVFNNRLRCKDGSVVTCRVHSRRILDEDGQATEFESYQENITDQVAAEEALRESEEKFRVLAETSPVAICIYQGEHVIYANPAMERLFGYSAEELCQMKFWDWVQEDFKKLVQSHGLARLAGEAVPGQYEVKYVTKEGEELHVLVSAGGMEYQGQPTGVASFLDISERKEAEELIRASLEEKEVLLREIHHRVKNNLQVVSSLLYLQAQKFSDPDLQQGFLESQSRICAMALAHEQLYQSKNLAAVSVKSYVENLVGQLQQVFQAPEQKVDCRLAVEDVDLDIEKVIPCGLLITELLSNAYKHAFVDGRKGHITVSMKCVDKEIVLTVADDGVGLPAEFDCRQAKTLGLQLVTALVNQLNGTLDLDRSNGTLFRVRFVG